MDETIYNLRPYQIDAINSILKKTKYNRKIIDIACGLGKTVIAANVMQKQKQFKHIVCIAPLRVSVEQLMNRITPFLPNFKHTLVDTEGITDETVIKNIINNTEYLVIYSTFKSAENIFSNSAILNPENVYLIVDEVHNGLKMCEFYKKFDNILFMSATIPDEFYKLMDNTEKVFSYGISNGIKNGYICDYEVFLPYIDKSNEIDKINDWESKCKFLVAGLEQTKSKRCIVYLKDWSEGDNFINTFIFTFGNKDNIWCKKIDSKMNSNDRTRLLNEFQNDTNYAIYILVSVRILDEAIDIPKCDSEFITYVGINNNDIRTVQRIQRGGRLDPTNPQKRNNLFLWAEDWSKAVESLTLLKESDIDFHKKVQFLYFTCFTCTQNDIEKLIIDKKMEFKKYLEVKCVSMSEIWNNNYKLLLEYGSIPKKSTRYKDVNLGQWVFTQRFAYRKGLMKKSKIQLFELVPGWTWGSYKIETKSWDEMFTILQEYTNTNHKIPTSTERYKDVTLGSWCFYQRQSYKDNVFKNTEKIQKLQSIPCWYWTDLENTFTKTSWEENFANLQEYVRQYDKLPHIETKIGAWCKAQKTQYKRDVMNRQTKLHPSKIEKLESIKNWCWTNDQWTTHYNILVEFVREFGRIPIRKDKYKGKTIGRWCVNQRSNYRNNMACDENRNIKLEQVEGWYWNSDDLNI